MSGLFNTPRFVYAPDEPPGTPPTPTPESSVIQEMRAEIKKVQEEAKLLREQNTTLTAKVTEAERAKLDEVERLKLEKDELSKQLTSLSTVTNELESLKLKNAEFSKFIATSYEGELAKIKKEDQEKIKAITFSPEDPIASLSKLQTMLGILGSTNGIVSQGRVTQPTVSAGGTGATPPEKIDPKTLTWGQALSNPLEKKS